MQTIQLVDLPISPEDFSDLESLVRSADPFLIQPSTISDKYDLSEYVHAAAFQDVSLYALLDNNILTRAVAFANGEKLSNESESRKVDQLAAAVMAFFLLSDFLLEPNIALYEKAWRKSHQHAASELKSFRIADHIHPQHYVNLALGRNENIPKDAINEAKCSAASKLDVVKEANFKKVLNHWKTSYLFLLKVTELWRSTGTDLKKAKALIDWMKDDAFFSAVSSVFGILLLSPSRPGRMLKGIGSKNATKLQSGLQNAAWDCVYVKHWVNQASRSTSDIIWFLCSNDKVLKQVGAALLHRQGEDSGAKVTLQLEEAWGKKKGGELYAHYRMQTESMNHASPARKQLVSQRVDNIDGMISHLENKLGLNQI